MSADQNPQSQQPMQPPQEPSQMQTPQTQTPGDATPAQTAPPVAGLDAAALYDAYRDLYSRYEQLQPLAALGIQAMHAQQNASLGPQQAQTQEPTQPPEPSFKWEVPQYDPAWEQRTRWDAERGMWVPATIYDSPAVAEARNRYEQEFRRYLHQLVSDPVSVVKKGLGIPEDARSLSEWIRQEIANAIEEGISGYHTLTDTANYLEQRAQDFFELDAFGNIKIGPDGREVYTPLGQAAVGFAIEARQLGITDPYKIRAYVDRMLALCGPALQQPAPEPPAQQPEVEAKPRRFVDRKSKSRAEPSLSTESGPSGVEPDLKSMLQAEAQKRGLA